MRVRWLSVLCWTACFAMSMAVASGAAVARLPPFGAYNSCEIDTAEEACEGQQSAMVANGITMEINYLSTDAHASGPNSLARYLQHAAAIGIMEWINVKEALADADLATGRALIAKDPTLAADCGVSSDAAVLRCIQSIAARTPGLRWGWYIYDEPGCPGTHGYCYASIPHEQAAHVVALGAFLTSISNNPILGIQTPGGVPPGGWSERNPVAREQIANFFSCNGQSGCRGKFSWITGRFTPNTGFDYYPYFGYPFGNVADIGIIARSIGARIKTQYAPETLSFTAQAFSGYQEHGRGCESAERCPFPTEAQLRAQRDQALYWAARAGTPIAYFFWYYWPDIDCRTNYPGCDAATNEERVRRASHAPFPTEPP